ncbi:MAG TPA: hypothetical protein VNZ45_14935, partial [Bacteroidia bacterium]|nr:hypothetical protein [Bacteroidia bacterium]
AFFDNSTGNFASNSGIILFTGNTTSKNYIGSAGLKTMTIQKLTMNLANPTDTLFLIGNNVLTVSTNDTLEKGVFHCQQYNFKGAAATKLDVQDNATLILGSKSNATAVTFPLNVTAANTTLTNNSTVIYEANANQAIFNATNYGNLYCYSGNAVGGSTKTPAANLTINGNLIVGDGTSSTGVQLPASTHTIALLGNATINTDGNLAFTTGPLNISGNFTNNRGAAGFTGGTGTVTFNSSTANQVIGGMNGATHETTNFNNVTIANTFSGGKVTLADSTVVGGIFNINSGGGKFDVSPSNYALMVNAGFNNNNTTTSFNAERGTVYFNGSQSIGNGVSSVATTFYDVVCKSGTVTMNAANDSLVA